MDHCDFICIFHHYVGRIIYPYYVHLNYKRETELLL